MLSTLPDQLHRFYKEDSTFSYGTEGETIESFVGDQVFFFKTKELSFRYKIELFISSFFFLFKTKGDQQEDLVVELQEHECSDRIARVPTIL